MDPLFRRSLKISTIFHVLIVLLLILIPSLVNRRIQKQRREIVTYVDFTVALPEPPSIQPVREIKPPEPPKPKPEPPKPSPVPEQTVKPKPTVQRSTNRVVRAPPKPAQPPLTAEEIRKLLAAGARISDRTSIPTDVPAGAWYYSVVRDKLYDAWVQPGGAVRPGTSVEVEIRVLRDGTIASYRMLRPSGNTVMDESVRRALETVKRLPPLPSEWGGPHRDISVEFVLESGRL